MLRIIVYVAIIYLSKWNVRGTVYEEGTFFKYHVKFDSDTEVPNLSEEKDELHVLLNGSRFKCSFYSENSLHNLYNPNTNKDIFSLLVKTINKPLKLSELYWKYIIFPGLKIFQLHENYFFNLYSLGAYNHSYFHKKNISSFSEKQQMYFTEVYVNGTLCDITGLRRITEIRYVCRLSEEEELVNVVEVSICRYVFYVYTFRICLAYGFGFQNVFHPIYCENEGNGTVNNLVKVLGTEDLTKN